MSKKKILIISIVIILFATIFIESNRFKSIIYPRRYSTYVEKYSKEFNIDENLVYSVIKAESKFDKNATSKKDAKGLMQIADITRDWAIDELQLDDVDIYDPETNIKIGCWYLNKLYKEFGALDLVIAAYNGGSGNVSRWLKNSKYSEDGKQLDNIPFFQTSTYLDKVKKNYKNYNEIYSKEGKN
ncbi:MAG: lytic transglycosylase domain-containing protein [Romboutsia sp.]|uniref:lytic transglycosylase domain-containing protein n=1 Tax=Romboutsia sp. TaxID=1965302 RepID=UPI003F3282ED